MRACGDANTDSDVRDGIDVVGRVLVAWAALGETTPSTLLSASMPTVTSMRSDSVHAQVVLRTLSASVNACTQAWAWGNWAQFARAEARRVSTISVWAALAVDVMPEVPP